MTSRLEKITKVESLQDILISRATGGVPDNQTYQALRLDLLGDDSIRGKLPRFVVTCRDLDQFWYYIKPQFAKYIERREYVWEQFQPLLFELEGIEDVPSKEPGNLPDATWSPAIGVEQNGGAEVVVKAGEDAIANTIGIDHPKTFMSSLEEEPLRSERLQPKNDPAENRRTVFVIHGRDRKAREALFTFLRSIGLHPLEWSEVVASTGMALPYIGDILDAAFSKAQAVVVLLTPDDEARLRKPFRGTAEPTYEIKLTPQARPNVLFEAGMAMGRSSDRTVLVEMGSLRPFSDIAGRHVVRLDNSTQRRQELAQRLRLAGCPVNVDGTDWHTVGDLALTDDETF